MLFVSPVFLFLFLPCALGGYYLLRRYKTAKNCFLLIISFFFYAWGEPFFSLVLLLSCLLNWLFALMIYHWRSHTALKKGVLILAVVYNVGLLFFYKYLNFSFRILSSLFLIKPLYKDIVLPIGISFFTFQAMSYVIDVYRGEETGVAQPQKNPLNVALYVSFFPQLIAGPIVRYKTISEEIENRKETLEDFCEGSIRFMKGFSKKILLANSMAGIADRAFSSDDLSVCFAWLGAFAYTLQIYYDFSGYSDMAIGLGRMFGFHFEENFAFPYAAKSVTDFWRRWHISLSRWFRDYVYIPLGGNRRSQARNMFNLFAVWFLTGLWHGANWTFIAWGLFYFVVLTLEKGSGLRQFSERHGVFGHIYTILIVTLAWVIFRAESISAAAAYLSTMFGKGSFYHPTVWVYIKENLLFAAAAVFFSFGLRFPAQRQALRWIQNALTVLAFAVSVIYMINGTYNPFLYFNF